MALNSTAQAFALVCAILSTVVSLSVCLTGVLFRSMMSSVFMRTIVTIAFCDFCGCLMLSLGYPSGALCSAQGFIGWLFIRGSWFFTVCLSLQLCSLLFFGRIIISERAMHAVAWALTIFFQCIPFAGNFNPGLNPKEFGTGWCFLNVGDDELVIQNWTLYNVLYFVVPLVGSLASLVLLSALVQFYTTYLIERYVVSGETSRNQVRSLVSAIQLYPLALFITWIPAVSSVLYFLPQASPESVQAYTDAFGTLYGVLLGLAFYLNSREARQRWYNYMYSSKAGEHIAIVIQMDEDLVATMDSEARLTRMTSCNSNPSHSTLVDNLLWKNSRVSSQIQKTRVSNINASVVSQGLGNVTTHTSSLVGNRDSHIANEVLVRSSLEAVDPDKNTTVNAINIL